MYQSKQQYYFQHLRMWWAHTYLLVRADFHRQVQVDQSVLQRLVDRNGVRLLGTEALELQIFVRLVLLSLLLCRLLG